MQATANESAGSLVWEESNRKSARPHSRYIDSITTFVAYRCAGPCANEWLLHVSTKRSRK